MYRSNKTDQDYYGADNSVTITHVRSPEHINDKPKGYAPEQIIDEDKERDKR